MVDGFASHLVSPMISAFRIARGIPVKLWPSFVHVHSTTVQHGLIECRNRTLGVGRLRHLDERDTAGFACIPVLDHRDGFDGSVDCKKLAQLLFRYRDIQVPDKNVRHECIPLIFPISGR